ncbi:ureidoglycolate dehydrogenase [Salibacterium aidingense]|uniref:ureidoglycolate dehydrogenase n=1 Tax=Salibacterium aidingense TaxID=384933 RepID=UPI003BE66A21
MTNKASEVVLSTNQLKELCAAKLIEHKVKPVDADIVADVLVHANLRGVDSHGVLRTEHYVQRISSKSINTDPNISIKRTGPASAIMDGDDGLGHVIAKQAVDEAISIAEKSGVGMVSVFNSTHCGALSYYVNQAIAKNFIGMAMTHTDKQVVPFGGAQPFFGTNPIALGFPASQNKPIILDMATSNAALGKILNAKKSGEPSIPENWGVNENGEPTTDPNQVAALLPFGGPKGYGLAMVVDLFSGVLTGSAFGPHITAMYGDYDKKRKLGHFFTVIDPAMFTEINTFLDKVDQMINEIHESKPAKGFNKVMVPGEPEQLKEEARLANGIPIPRPIYDYLSN